MKILNAGGFYYAFDEEAERHIQAYEIPDDWIILALAEYTQREVVGNVIYQKVWIRENEKDYQITVAFRHSTRYVTWIRIRP